MSLFKGLKRAFGVSDEAEDEEVYQPSYKREPYINPFKKDAPDSSAGGQRNEQLAQSEENKVVSTQQATPQVASKPGVVAVDFPKDVFDGIIKLINHNLPEIVQKSINLDVERQAIYSTMGPQLEAFVSAVNDSAMKQSQMQWVNERSTLTDKISSAEAKAEEATKKVAELRERLNTEMAQRKAVATRAQDLEMKIAKYEAEYEQFQIENKSLVARMRAMQVSLDDATRNAEDVASLRTEMSKLKVQNVELSDNLNSAKKLIQEQNNELEALRKVSGDVKELEAEFKQKLAMNNQLISESHNTAVKHERAAAEANEKLRAANELIAEQNEELEVLREDMKIAEELQAEIEKVEEFKARKNEEIKELKEIIASLKTQHQDELAVKEAALVAKDTELNNVRREKMQVEAERIAPVTPATPNFINDDPFVPAFVPAAEPKKQEQKPVVEKKSALDFGDNFGQELGQEEKPKPAKRKKREAKPKAQEETSYKPAIPVSAIDELDDLDWLIPSPPSEAEPVVQEPEPEEKPKPVVEQPQNQMSLFD